MGDVFVSYCGKDRRLQQFQDLLDDLDELDRRPWYDQRLEGGIEWWDDILEHIRSCDLFVAALSEKWVRSVACQREWQYALSLHRPVLPVMLTRVSDEEIPQDLRAKEIIDYSGRETTTKTAGQCTTKLGRALQSLSAGAAPALPSPLPPAPPMPPSYTEILVKYIDAPELNPSQQRDMIGAAKSLVNNDEDDRLQLRNALERLLQREDIGWKIRPELEDLARRLGVTPTGEGGTKPSEQTRPGTRLQVRLFHAPGVDLWKLAENLTRFYASQQLDSEKSRNSVGGYVIRCHSAKMRARMTGAGAQLTVTLSTQGDDLSVVISGQRWGDKAASMGTGLVAAMATSGAALPLVVPSIIGGVRQAKLPKQTFDYIEKVLPICIE